MLGTGMDLGDFQLAIVSPSTIPNSWQFNLSLWQERSKDETWWRWTPVLMWNCAIWNQNVWRQWGKGGDGGIVATITSTTAGCEKFRKVLVKCIASSKRFRREFVRWLLMSSKGYVMQRCACVRFGTRCHISPCETCPTLSFGDIVAKRIIWFKFVVCTRSFQWDISDAFPWLLLDSMQCEISFSQLPSPSNHPKRSSWNCIIN